MRSRSHFTGVWLNDAEYRQLMQLCQSSGLSASAMIRKCILGETVKPRPPDCYAELLRVLSGIGTNINQLAHWRTARAMSHRHKSMMPHALREKRGSWCGSRYNGIR